MLFLSIKDKCQTYSKAQTVANMSSGNLPTEAAKHEMHPHDTTGAKTHLYGAYYKAFMLCERKNKELRDQQCHSSVGENM